VKLAGLVLVRQKPGSAKGVMFITLEDETGIANLVVWPKVFEVHRRVVLAARMLGVEGYVQREGEVVHVVVRKLIDMSATLASLSEQDAPFPLPHGRGDEFHHGGSPDQRGREQRALEAVRPQEPQTAQAPQPHKVRDIYIPDLALDTIKLKAREFR
jgi:error-prone DNA polymerase